MKTTKKNFDSKKKLLTASTSLLISAAMLGTSTYAWFTMNKEVKVTGMEVKAHAEEGLLINEVATANSPTWDDQATGGATSAVVMRPASTSDLVTWWHANSKLSADEAGVDNLSGTVSLANGDKYLNISPANISDSTVFDSGEGNAHAETHVYYKDASFGNTSGTREDGEGFYVKYTYYLKSSGDADLDVSNLQVKVKATKNTTGANASGSSDDLDPCLRVGVTMNTTASGSTVAGTRIFAPITGGQTSYGVTSNVSGGSKTTVTATSAATGSFSSYETLNKDSSTKITIPKVTSNGTPVYVYVWFEGEDEACMSDNLTDALAAYDIDVQFYDADIY